MGWRTPQSGRGHPQASGSGFASVLPPREGRRRRDTDRGHAGDPDDGKVPFPVALLLVRPTNRMVRMVANPAQANGQIPVVSRPSTEKATRTSSALLHPHPMAGGRPYRPPPGGRPQGTRSAGCRTNPRLSPPAGHTGSSPLPCQALAYAPTSSGNRVKELVDDLPFFHDTLA